MKVRLLFEGSIVVNIDADPEDDLAWIEAIEEAWNAASDEEVIASANLTQHEIEEEEAVN